MIRHHDHRHQQQQQQQRYHKQQRYHSSNPAAAMAPVVTQYRMQPAIPLGRRRHPRVRRIMVLRRSFRNKMLSAEQFFRQVANLGPILMRNPQQNQQQYPTSESVSSMIENRLTPLNATAEHVSSSLQGVVSRSASRLSFKHNDEFFHGMLSYRVRTEGPSDKGGNNLARLIYDACNAGNLSNRLSETTASESFRQHSQAFESFGKWPKAFSGQSEPIRLFLDQVNLRMGVPWKGTGDADSGGFLGAVSQALIMVPLFSATPALFKVKVVFADSPLRYEAESPINMKLTNGAEFLSIQVDNVTGTETIRGHLCQDVQPDGSFQLSNVPDDIAPNFPSNFQFYSPTNFLPSDGSGPRGSLADLLNIQQKPEHLTFSVISSSDTHTILQANQLSDHIFFINETISLEISIKTLSGSVGGSGHFSIIQVVCQGSKAGALHSKIKIDAGEKWDCFKSDSLVKATTQEIDRCDNVLMELMLSRALRTLSASGNLHSCKLIMPVFVDDMDMLYPLSDRLSDKNSIKTSSVVESALEAILKRKLTLAEVKEWIETPVKNVVKFFFDFQGLQLSDKTNRYKSMKEKASLVHMHFVTTAGIEANNSALFQYVSNNPLAHELLDFLDSYGLMHLHPVLRKHDITSVKEFSQLSPSAVEKIAHDGHVLSIRPLMKETVEICGVVSAAQSSKLILPVSKRLELFEDKDASFLTVIYSSYALYLALQKPLFAVLFQILYFVLALTVGITQILDDPRLNAQFIIPNFTRASWMLSAMICLFVFKSLKAALRSWIFWCFITGSSSAVAFIIDSLVNGAFKLGESKYCAIHFSPQVRPADYNWCAYYYMFAYFGFNVAFYWTMTCFILFRQDLVWRWLCIGITFQMVVSTYSDHRIGVDITAGIVGCICVPSSLALTEILRFYGTLQALQITKKDSIINAKRWQRVLGESRQDLEQMAQTLHGSFDDSVYDRSSDLGKYASTVRVAKRPAPIRQPIKDFDELYNVASIVNNTFQTWVESFFGSEIHAADCLYVAEHANIDHLYQHLRFESFRGIVSRGPVKLPRRAIAKVYRTYHGDVSLITDIVRCAVQFETVAEMGTFVSSWIMKYGLARRSSNQVGWMTTIYNETREFLRIFREYFRIATPNPDAGDAVADDVRYSMLTVTSDEDFKLFEIHRIRNRFDPDLIEAPGGYRDLAFKLKIGFVRLPESGLVRILPVQMWSTSTLRPKFIIVEMQLLIQVMKSDEQMHHNYASMRDKMTN